MNFVFLFLRKTSLETSLEETCVKPETMLIETMLSEDPTYGHICKQNCFETQIFLFAPSNAGFSALREKWWDSHHRSKARQPGFFRQGNSKKTGLFQI